MAFDGITIANIVHELRENLLDGRINKIAQPETDELLLTIKTPKGQKRLSISASASLPLIYLTETNKPSPMTAPNFCMLLRKHINNGRITAITQPKLERIIRFEVEHLDELGDLCKKYLIIEIMGKHSNLILTDATHRILDTIKHISPLVNRYRSLQPGATYILPPTQEKQLPTDIDFETFSSLIVEGERYDKQLVAKFQGLSPLIAREIIYRSESDSIQNIYDSFTNVLTKIQEAPSPHVMIASKEYFYLLPLYHIEGELIPCVTLWDMFDRYYFGKDERDRIKQQFHDIERFIRQEYDKNVKKLEKLNEELVNSEKAEQYKVLGELILANIYQIKRGDSVVRVQNFYSENLEELDIPLEPMLSASENAQKYFQKYTKAKNAVNYILEQLELTEKEIAYFETLMIQIETATLKDAYEIKEELELAGYLRKHQIKKRKTNGKPNIEKYLSTDGVEIFVGKNNLQNDYLTHKFARRHEWWFHAKDMPGSHVLVRSDADELSEATIRSAAQLASYFSKGRLSSSVPIDYTRVRHVKKVPAAHLGFVTYENQKTIYIDPDESFIMNLTKLK